MRACATVQQQVRAAEIAHHLRDKRVDGVDIGDDAGHFGQGGKAEGEAGNCGRYDITHRQGPSCS